MRASLHHYHYNDDFHDNDDDDDDDFHDDDDDDDRHLHLRDLHSDGGRGTEAGGGESDDHALECLYLS